MENGEKEHGVPQKLRRGRNKNNQAGVPKPPHGKAEFETLDEMIEDERRRGRPGFKQDPYGSEYPRI